MQRQPNTNPNHTREFSSCSLESDVENVCVFLNDVKTVNVTQQTKILTTGRQLNLNKIGKTVI